MKSASPTIPTLILLALITLSAFALRASHLDRPSLWEDDYLGLDRALTTPARVFSLQKFQGPSRTSYDFQPPLYYVLVHYALWIDNSVIGAKMAGVAAGTLAVLAFFLLGRTLYDDRAGLFAALLCALNLSHIAASQGIKAYALFHLLNAASFAFLWRSLRRGGFLNWGFYALSGLGLVYASYIGLPLVAGQALLAAGYAVAKKREGAVAGPILLPALAAFAVILAGFSPYIEGVFFFRDFMTDSPSFAVTRITPEAWPDLLGGFYFFKFQAGVWWWTATLAAAALGVAGFLKNKKGTVLFLTLLAIAVPVCAALFSRSSHPLEYRHFAPLFLPAVLLPACGLAYVSESLSKKIAKPWGKALGPALGLGLCVLVSLPSLFQLDQFYRTSLSYDKALFFDLALNKYNVDYLEFAEFQAETKRLGAAWTLGGLYKDLSDDAPAPYKRAYLVHNDLSGNPAFHPGPFAHPRETFSTSIFNTGIYALGLVNRSPIVMTPRNGRYVYAEDFGSLRLFNDCAQARNVFPELTRGMLKATNPEKPASLDYAFLIPEAAGQGAITNFVLTVDAALYKRSARWPADSRIVVSASRDGGPFEEAAVIDFSAFTGPDGGYEPKQCPHFLVYFNSRCSRVERRIPLFTDNPPKQSLRIRFALASGLREGHLALDAFRLEADAPDDAFRFEPLLRRSFEELVHNVRLVKWDASRQLAFCDSLYAFDRTGTLGCESPEAVCDPPGELARYLALHPGARPVYALPGPDGGAAVELYDPSLDDPFVRLSASRPSAVIDRDARAPMTVKSVTITGALDVPDFAADGQAVHVPVYAPQGSTLVLNAGGEGRLYLHPKFTREEYRPGAFLNAYNVGRNEREGEDGCLTCREDYRCFFTYSVVSAYPILSLSLENHMRAFMDAQGENAVRALVSLGETDAFQTVEELSSDGSGTWKTSDGFTRTLTFDKPVNALKIRYEMTGQGAQLWSAKRPIDDMRLTLRLDARAFAPFSLTRNPAVLSMQKPGVEATGYFFSETPQPFFDALRHVE